MKNIGRLFLALSLASQQIGAENISDKLTFPKTPLEVRVNQPAEFRVASVELGNPADQRVFLDFFGKYDSTKTFAVNGRDLAFEIPFAYSFWDSLSSKERLDSIYSFASQNTSKISEELRSAHVLHISGHHSGASPLVFGGEMIDTGNVTYNFKSGIRIDELPVNENAQMVFLLYCFGNRANVTFGGNFMHDKFPNALILGYGHRSPAGESNSKLLKEYFSLLPENFGEMPKADLASLWIKAGQRVFSEKSRDCRATWMDKNIIFEYNTNNKVTTKYKK